MQCIKAVAMSTFQPRCPYQSYTNWSLRLHLQKRLHFKWFSNPAIWLAGSSQPARQPDLQIFPKCRKFKEIQRNSQEIQGNSSETLQIVRALANFKWISLNFLWISLNFLEFHWISCILGISSDLAGWIQPASSPGRSADFSKMQEIQGNSRKFKEIHRKFKEIHSKQCKS